MSLTMGFLFNSTAEIAIDQDLSIMATAGVNKLIAHIYMKTLILLNDQFLYLLIFM